MEFMAYEWTVPMGWRLEDMTRDNTIVHKISRSSTTTDIMDELCGKKYLILDNFFMIDWFYYGALIIKPQSSYSTVKKGLTFTGLKSWKGLNVDQEHLEHIKERLPNDPIIPLLEQIWKTWSKDKLEKTILFEEAVMLRAQRSDRFSGFGTGDYDKKYGETYGYQIVGILTTRTHSFFEHSDVWES